MAFANNPKHAITKVVRTTQVYSLSGKFSMLNDNLTEPLESYDLQTTLNDPLEQTLMLNKLANS